ncbi:alpha/beta hydrolase fold [Lucifera butyrica]|uniref:Alpha/beta hydrolase fold n=1 Tax=Lucifera butyrica TaxID=1351585 RepID=A0A498R9X4_9FIRM|nr:prolyl oligopeptidase family serine peptidase [Lucifera butyrica]VBB09496.1 alpha/beta hydrolase fold [Lucifera butyrica]
MDIRRKLIKIFSMVVIMMFFLTGMVLAQAAEPSYRTVTEVYDWGAAIPRVIVDLGRDLKAGAITKDTFRVYVKRKLAEGSTPLAQTELEGYREITDVYVADKDGNAAKAGHYAVIEMKVGPTVTLGAALNFDMNTYFNNWVRSDYTITQVKPIKTINGNIEDLVIDKSAGNIRPIVDNFTFSHGSYAGVSLPYASFAPKDNKRHPLIIWLHGMGEGGSDNPSIPISANKADMFSAPGLQSHFGGAYVLVPQAPTYWMHGFTGMADGTSIYEKSLMGLIENYVASHKNIDASRIYIGGDSNGGYMTMVMIRDYPNYFAAAFPTCEGLRDSLISDADIEALKNSPIWFIAAKTDTILPPADYVVPTFKRLQDAGAKDVHFSFFDNVHDMTGLYKNADGSPYEYNGHWSWIYVYNDQCAEEINGQQVKLMDWLAAQKRK